MSGHTFLKIGAGIVCISAQFAYNVIYLVSRTLPIQSVPLLLRGLPFPVENECEFYTLFPYNGFHFCRFAFTEKRGNKNTQLLLLQVKGRTLVNVDDYTQPRFLFLRTTATAALMLMQTSPLCRKRLQNLMLKGQNTQP